MATIFLHLLGHSSYLEKKFKKETFDKSQLLVPFLLNSIGICHVKEIGMPILEI